MTRSELAVKDYAAGVVSGDRRVLARAITLVESVRPDHEELAQELLQELLPRTGNAVRVGVSGPPGVGKSTFLDALGSKLAAAGRRLAVLAVDPSSQRTGGSILGDKTRMDRLAREPSAFVRPSPGADAAGGVARRTREVMLLCEAAGHDVVLVETIGAGQAEVAVTDMVDTFLVLVQAGAGDELQGIKRGIMELADVLVVNKADGDERPRAMGAAAELAAAQRMLHADHGAWQTPVLAASARTEQGLDEVWEAVERHRAHLGAGGLRDKRREQAVRWFDAAVVELLRREILATPRVAAALPRLRERVRDGSLHPTRAAGQLLDLRRSS